MAFILKMALSSILLLPTRVMKLIPILSSIISGVEILSSKILMNQNLIKYGPHSLLVLLGYPYKQTTRTNIP